MSGTGTGLEFDIENRGEKPNGLPSPMDFSRPRQARLHEGRFGRSGLNDSLLETTRMKFQPHQGSPVRASVHTSLRALNEYPRS